ncbi:MAG: OmpA family protein [Saprospiraceae bacterium]|nr:OmpA family protein [Saprospiraceae bacterium]MDW8229866.1 OmpA family protein [Saprospiraceae bacterium]
MLWLSFPLANTAQALKDGDNLVPNPGFERFVAPPVGWSYRGSFFGQVVKYWFSPTTASPDVYGPGVKVPQDWADKGFGKQIPHSGQSMAGLTLWGCTNGKPHCREYVSIQLAEPLVPGQGYHIEFWVTPLPRSLRINRIGAFLSNERIERKTDELLDFVPHFFVQEIVQPKEGAWVKLSGQFVATNEAEYLIIGNFFTDEQTQTKTVHPESFNYAYYYIDDVLLKKIPPFQPIPIKPDDITRQSLEPGKAIQLKSIYFEFDKYELMPRSYVELNKLLQILRENPTLHIAIVGHTDNIGTVNYNLWLSRKRAKAVWQFLLDSGIAAERLQYRGEGKAKPIAPNDTETGRFQNRRVEFVILKK